MRVAAVDPGSNSFHLPVAEISGPATFGTVLREKMTVQWAVWGNIYLMPRAVAALDR